jgi:glutamate 5-kinase
MDAGAAQALLHEGKSLLAVGITQVGGAFERGQTVRLLDDQEREIGRGITHYDAEDLVIIRGHRSDEISDLLGYEYGPAVVHRDDMVLI